MDTFGLSKIFKYLLLSCLYFVLFIDIAMRWAFGVCGCRAFRGGSADQVSKNADMWSSSPS
jgi:hypothetical protein